MTGAPRHPDQVAPAHFEPNTGRRVDVEQATAVDNEADLVLVVPVLAIELREHDLEVGRISADVDHVGRHISAPRLERFDLIGVRRASTSSALASPPTSGFPLLTAFCAVLTLTAWALVWRQMHGPVDIRLVLFALACAGATTIWSVRPQVFSIVMLPVIAILVARDRWWLIPPAIALWANLHAGVAMGLVVVGASVAAAVRDREYLLPRAACFAASVAATLATPLGVRSWTELVASVARSRANRIQEWQPTPLPPEQMAFWGWPPSSSGNSCGSGDDCRDAKTG